MYRGIVARMNYLGQDRTDIQNTIKELGKDLAGPTNHSIVKAKRLMRYLKGAPRLTILYNYQSNPGRISAWSDSDFAGCEKSRKSTSGGVLMHGNHLIKSWSVNQSVIALSSGEAEYYALVKSATIAFGVQSLCADLGVIYIDPIELKSDASAAIGICNRIGLGKVRHIEVNQLWLQEKVAQKKMAIIKVGTLENLADALTKALDAESMRRHLVGVNAGVRTDRHNLTPKLEADFEESPKESSVDESGE